MAQLPLKLRVDLRDHWEKPDSPVQEAISALSQLVGLKVNVTLEAPMLWRELGKHFQEQENFVPNVVDVIKLWADCMTCRLEKDVNEAWVEQLLEQCGRSLNVIVETQSGPLARTKWDDTSTHFIISIPKSPPPYKNVSSSFMTDLENLFNKTSPNNAPTSELPMRRQGAGAEGWVDIESPRNRPAPPKIDLPTKPQALPQLDTLARPDSLFLHQTPYHMTVRTTGKCIVVQGSHQPSLELLASYLKKWTRTMRNDVRKAPVLNVDLQESLFGLGILFDTVAIEAANDQQTWLNVNPIFVIGFIESVLGYQLVLERRTGDDWYFRREERILER